MTNFHFIPITLTEENNHHSVSSTSNTVSTASTSATTTSSSSLGSSMNESVIPSPTVQQQTDSNRDTKRQQRQWLQRSIVRRSLPAIETKVSRTIQNSSFLRKYYHLPVDDTNHDSSTTIRQSSIPLLHRREIEIGPLVGSGGFSDVYQITGCVLDQTISDRCTPEQQVLRMELVHCIQHQTRKLVLKQLKRQLVHASTKMFTNAACDLIMEASYMSALDHPNIVSVRALPIDGVLAYQQGEYDGYFIIMDQLDGTLGDQIQKWKINVETAPSIKEKANYALQIASALDYLHTQCRIVFRDLKPHNMGFDSNTGAIQLFDFGLCRELPTISGMPNDNNNMDDVYEMSGVGTRRYMAPEIINDGKYNTKVDVYSWAMVFSELLTGTKPYAKYGTEEHRVAVCQQGERPRLQFYWPLWLQLVLQKSWCESISDRWSMQQVIQHISKQIQVVTTNRPVRLRPNSILDSPVDVMRMDEYMISPMPSSDWHYIPDLPELNGSTDASSSNIHVRFQPLQYRQQRHSFHPRLQPPSDILCDIDDTSSILKWDNNNSRSVEQQQQRELTICLQDGGVEVCPTVPILIPSSPKLLRNIDSWQTRASSCVL